MLTAFTVFLEILKVTSLSLSPGERMWPNASLRCVTLYQVSLAQLSKIDRDGSIWWEQGTRTRFGAPTCQKTTGYLVEAAVATYCQPSMIKPLLNVSSSLQVAPSTLAHRAAMYGWPSSSCSCKSCNHCEEINVPQIHLPAPVRMSCKRISA